MTTLLGLTLLRPGWLLALPLVAVLAFLFTRRASALAAWDRAVDPRLMAAMERLGRVVPGRRRGNWPPTAAAVLIALALVGPAAPNDGAPTFRNLAGLVLVMDLSRSVTDGGGFTRAQSAARLVAQGVGARPVALVVYAGDAYLASAFTTDARALGTTVAVLDGDTVPDQGSRPERALALARQVLAEAQIIAGDVVLVSDGSGIDAAALVEARAIAAAGGRLSTVFASPGGESPADMPAPDAEALAALAEAGGGVAGDALDAAPVADAIMAGSSAGLVPDDLAALLWTDYGRYLLFFALIPAIALFRKRT